MTKTDSEILKLYHEFCYGEFGKASNITCITGKKYTEQAAIRLYREAFKAMKRKDYVPDEFSLSNFEIEKMKNGQIHEGALEGY